MIKKAKLTEKGRKIYDYIVEYKTSADGNSPSYRDIAMAMGIGSPSTVSRHLDLLEEQGLITRVKHGMIQVDGGRWVPPES